MARTWNIYATVNTYGDGLTDDEMLALACAERDAVLRHFPGTQVRITMVDGDGTKPSDPEIGAWVFEAWGRVNTAECNGGDVADAIAKWAKE